MKKLVSIMFISLFVAGIIFAQTPSNENDSNFRQAVKFNPLVTVLNAVVNGDVVAEGSYEYAVTDLFTVSPMAAIGYTQNFFNDETRLAGLSVALGCGFKFNFFRNYLQGFYGEVDLGLETVFLTDGTDSITLSAFSLPLMLGYEGILKNGFVWDLSAGFDILHTMIKVNGSIGFAW